jgi:CspA family cold shock protein
MKKTGTVTFFNENRGFGFIKERSGEIFFAHVSQIRTEGHTSLKINQLVEFDSIKGPKGLQATGIHIIETE